MSSRENEDSVPRGNIAGFFEFARADIRSGFLVFLIALPLCLGISLACGYPPIAGVFTAIVGGFVTPLLTNSELTIKGPAAGLIVVIAGCVAEFSGDGMSGGWAPIDQQAYRAALAIGFAAAILQMIFASFRAGILGEFFPISVVHGMLAGIGIIICIKQLPIALGVAASGEPLEILTDLPHLLAEANPAIAVIGISSLVIMFAWPACVSPWPFLRKVPAPIVVLLVAMPAGYGFDLLHEHSYYLQGHEYQLGEQFLVSMPKQVFGMFRDVTLPNFAVLTDPRAWKWAIIFFCIGSLESVLSAKAIDAVDPWKRRSNMDRDLFAVGAGNLIASLLGGLPMISEIVRSKANIDNGGKTRFANFWHAVFLLLCVAIIPTFLHLIPLAALAAMLVYTGFRLTHPTEFVHIYRIGREQLAIFITTMVMVVVTDLLVGVLIGVILKVALHLANGVPVRSLFKPYLEVEDISDDTSLIRARDSAVFSNWIPFRRQIEQVGLVQKRNLVIDLSGVQLVDDSVLEKLEEMREAFELEGLGFAIRGLDSLIPMSDNVLATRKRTLGQMKRLTIMAPSAVAEHLIDEFFERGVTGYTITECKGGGRQFADGPLLQRARSVRLEVLVPTTKAAALIEFLRSEILPEFMATICLETVEVLHSTDFD